ncbi:GGDEF domain-containing protein [Paraburkholderia sp. J8-2]|uniref:GGDEF domain-containing protein n=1 Tax=Paraburkholderia sp. J8-2 TaxID=2805440 RepID=UPI002AB74362|nr:GGDEF domain-containing protein [Paraburkholderia sp. J8-2]
MIKAAGTWLFVRELRRRQRAEALMERMAHRDSLTGLENRGTFDEVLEMEWKRARRDGKPLSLLFIDIDRFKAYNDHYGHQAGDVALKTVARQISKCIDRPGDHVARYGGEEFVVVLPDTDTAGAILIAERIRTAIFDLHVSHSQTPTGFLTVSVGISPKAIATVTCAADLLKTADAALYEAKGLGRDRVCVVQQPEAELTS